VRTNDPNAPTAAPISRFLADPDATAALGRALGAAAVAGDVIAAVGTLGAGKTCLAQGVARGLQVPAEHYVNSPTFAIMQAHPGRLVFHHIDLYRIADPDEALGLGLEEVVGIDGVAYVEWPGRLPEVIPRDTLWLRIEPEGDGRRIVLAPQGPRSVAWIQRVFANERWADSDT